MTIAERICDLQGKLAELAKEQPDRWYAIEEDSVVPNNVFTTGEVSHMRGVRKEYHRLYDVLANRLLLLQAEEYSQLIARITEEEMVASAMPFTSSPSALR